MRYTPVELRHVRMGRALFGYKRDETDRVLEDVADSFEEVWRSRADLADKVEHLEGEITRYKELEQLLRATLISAERAAHELRDQATREAETIVAEAHLEGRAVTQQARAERERLLRDARRIRLLLNSALDSLDEAEELDRVTQDEPPAAEAA